MTEQQIPDTTNCMALPELNEAELDDHTLTALFYDIETCTQVLEVIVRHVAAGYVGPQRVSLKHARRLVQERAVRGVQIRYVYDEAEWWDTLMVLPTGVRIIRIEHEPQPQPVAD